MAITRKKQKVAKKAVVYRTADLTSEFGRELTFNEAGELYSVPGKKTVNAEDVMYLTKGTYRKLTAKIANIRPSDKIVQIPSQDYADQFIAEKKIQIDTIFIDKKHDHLLFVLNNGLTMQEKISKYPLLKKASEKQLKKYNLYAGGTCVEWEELDEDLSLRGLLKDLVFEPMLKSMTKLEGFVLGAA